MRWFSSFGLVLVSVEVLFLYVVLWHRFLSCVLVCFHASFCSNLVRVFNIPSQTPRVIHYKKYTTQTQDSLPYILFRSRREMPEISQGNFASSYHARRCSLYSLAPPLCSVDLASGSSQLALSLSIWFPSFISVDHPSPPFSPHFSMKSPGGQRTPRLDRGLAEGHHKPRWRGPHRG